MELTDKFDRIALGEIAIRRESRQRRKIFDDKGQFINDDGLLESVAEHGIMQPLLIRRETMELVFGERRYTAAQLSGHIDAPVRYVEDLDASEAMVLELEENLRRKALPWRDEVRAVAALHEVYTTRERALGKSWSIDRTERLLNYTQLNEALRVARDLDSPRLAMAESVRSAWNILARLDERKTADLVSDIIDGTQDIFAGAGSASQPALPGEDGGGSGAAIGPAVAGVATETVSHPEATPAPLVVAESILCTDFIEWAQTYSGPTFNFIHCDFPYGVGVFAGPQSGVGRHHTYDDSDDVYWALIDALGTNLDRICAHSAHLMFWCSADALRIARTIEHFRRVAPSLIFDTFPLVWHKTDNTGILPDPKRGPRRVYETALIASREDRFVVKSVSNAYGAPTDKSHHPSAKPEPILRHFFQMFVDENTRLLDPTCGSGSALRAAESLGAAQVLGLECDSEHATTAQTALRQFRLLRKATAPRRDNT